MDGSKTVDAVLEASGSHWVGGGFPVRTIFSVHSRDAAAISPFLLLDHAGPHEFPPAADGVPRGVDRHPHRGFETVTILYSGELEHRDSSGASGRIGPGDVQWMTAGSGVVHEEKHSAAFTRRGGTLEMIQLWVNLPAKAKRERPRYQDLERESIPTVDLPGGGGTLRVIAGTHRGTRGPARTFTPINLWDASLAPGASTTLALPRDTTTIVVVVRGVAVLGDRKVEAHRGVLFSRDGETISLGGGERGATVLVLNGEPIDEPVVAHGPFVMNTREEIRQATADYQAGRMGTLSPDASG